MSDSNKDLIIESLKRRIKKIEEENKQLRNQLKVAYADMYKTTLKNNGIVRGKFSKNPSHINTFS